MSDFLFVTWSGGGNIHPLVALGTLAIRAGHRVRVLGPAELASRFESAGIGFRPFADDSSLRGVADDVIAAAGEQRTDALVVDYMQPQALSAAEVLGLP